MNNKCEYIHIRTTKETKKQLKQLTKFYHKNSTQVIEMIINKEYLENTENGQSDLKKLKEY